MLNAQPVQRKVKKAVKPQKERAVRLTYHEKKELQTLEETLPLLEQQLHELDEQLHHVSDFASIQALSCQRNQLEEDIETKSNRWLILLEKEEQSH